ncbi:MAG: tryptophan--tRNA ligase [Candidatus Parcubacteria bacterium]|nr:tryptophan--tRNA ligase [Candidatus Parcubacteria bacterium]
MNDEGLPVVVSGIRATGKLHLGNYFGAIRNFFPLQEKHQCFFFVADYHTLTTHPDPDVLRQNRLPIVKTFLATGIDPNRSVVYYQSSLPEVAELTLLLGMVVQLGELERCTTFKEKVRENPDNVNHGLLTYPVLMASDILIHRATIVPVGSDQIPHVEMARAFAHRFNHLYENIFAIPKTLENEAVRLPGLDGSKMGKSHNNGIDLLDDATTIREKVKSGLTDTNRIHRNDPGDPLNNCGSIYPLHNLLCTDQEIIAIMQGCKAGTLSCVECKQMAAEKVVALLAPIQEKYYSYNDDYVRDVLVECAKRAKVSARPTLHQVRQAMGLD